MREIKVWINMLNLIIYELEQENMSFYYPI